MPITLRMAKKIFRDAAILSALGLPFYFTFTSLKSHSVINLTLIHSQLIQGLT